MFFPDMLVAQGIIKGIAAIATVNNMRISIVSGTDRPILRSDVNHRRYAKLHGYEYKFDTSVYKDLATPHFRKIHSVKSVLNDCNWAFWLDDDAFFTNMAIPLETFLNDIQENHFLVICKSPVNPKGGWTFLSAGQFFLKNDRRSQDFLDEVLATPVETVRAWWDASRYGIFTGGDQDAIVYTLVTRNMLEDIKIYPYDAFNSRPYHYGSRLDEHFLVHFPGGRNKRDSVIEFGARFGVDETLINSDQTLALNL